MQYLVSLPADNYLPYIVSEFFFAASRFARKRPILPRKRSQQPHHPDVDRGVAVSGCARHAATSEKASGNFQLRRPALARREQTLSRRLRPPDARHRHFPQLASTAGIDRDFLRSKLRPPSAARGDTLLHKSLRLDADNFYLAEGVGRLFSFTRLACRTSWVPSGVGRRLRRTCLPLASAGAPFAGGLGLFYALEVWRGRCETRSLLSFAFTFVLFVIPWIVWTKLYLQIPSDLVWENVAGPGTDAALASPLDFVWVRLRNFSGTFAPGMFFVYPFDAGAVVEWARDCLPGAVGIFMIVPAFMEALKISRRSVFAWCAIALPLFAITAIFSLPAIPLLHGYQSVVGALIFFGVIRLARNFSPAAFWSIVILQLAANVTLLEMRAYLAGLHLP